MTMMYFGTRDRMQWVKCPASGMGRGSQRYSSDGVFTNGGGWSTSSLAGHLVYEMNWNFLRQTEKEAIRDYYDGTYGSGLIYFLDPFAMSRNVLPAAWANPALALEGGPPLSPDAPYAADVALAHSLGAPTRSIVYSFSANSQRSHLWIPVPDGYTLHIGALNATTGDVRLNVEADSGISQDIPEDTLLEPHNLLGTSLSQCGGGATLRILGSGDITLQGIMAQVLPDGQAPTAQGFISGQGHSGCRFSGDIVDTGYSAPSALDYSALSFTLRETGSWE